MTEDEMHDNPLDCPDCGRDPLIEREYYGVSVYCTDCYDGAPDAGPQLFAAGPSVGSAIYHWNQAVLDDRHS